jgi:hypothetical protein
MFSCFMEVDKNPDSWKGVLFCRRQNAVQTPLKQLESVVGYVTYAIMNEGTSDCSTCCIDGRPGNSEDDI